MISSTESWQAVNDQLSDLRTRMHSMIDKHFDQLSCQANNAQERQWKVFEVAIERIESLKLRELKQPRRWQKID
jgi:hypothetical protein